jgi:hypothetical protein
VAATHTQVRSTPRPPAQDVLAARVLAALAAASGAHPVLARSVEANAAGALRYAAVRGAVDELQQLLSEGADIEACAPG